MHIPFVRAQRYAPLSLWVWAALSSPAWGLPTGAQVAAGQAMLTRPDGQTLQVNQSTGKAILNWQQFNIQANEQVRFVQPGSSAVALNRVVGNDPSAILGRLSANGRVFLVNPNGILFGAGSKVDVGGLIASTLNISDQDFLQGRYQFAKDSRAGSVINQGQITAQEQGYVALLGSKVANEGIIQARLGTVALAAGDKITLDMAGDKLINLAVDQAAFDASVSNRQLIQAPGGTVIMSAKAANALVRSVVNNEGVIEAHSLVERGGVVRLEASDAVANSGQRGAQQHLGEVKNAAGGVSHSGTIDVSAVEDQAAAGSVTLSGQRVLVDGSISARGYDQARGGNVLVTSTEKTGVTAGSIINTSGGAHSSAGNTVVWSDNDTLFSGTLLATGGAHGGNGGALEVSGHEKLNHSGYADARAPSGATGSLLLDPHNIVIANAGAAVLTDADQFAVTPASDVTIAPATLNAAGANIILQANNNITFTNAVSVAGAGIGLTAQAGRSILVNANITTNNAPITLTANETVANGVVNANRDAGAAVITMATTATLASGGGDINLAVNTGAGLTNFASGDITLQGINAGAGHVLITNNGTTAGSGIVRSASAAQLITAASAALDVNGAGAGGEIGTSIAPIRVSVTHLEARGQSLGAFFNSPTQAVNIGGATLGGLTGITTSSGNGAISVTTTAGSITTSEALSASGSGVVTLTAAGAASSITLNDVISSGSGAISLTAANGITLSGANADVTTTGAYTAIADSDANGTGIYAQNDAGSAVSSAQVVITAQDIDLQGTINAGAANVFLRPALAATTIGVEDASKTFQLTSTELDNITTTGILTVGIATNTGGITIGTDGAVSQNKALTFLTSTGAITTNGALSTTGNKNIIMTTTNAPIAVNGSIDVAGSGSVTLTAAGAINGAITLNNAISSGSGAVNLTAANGITLSGTNADVVTTGAYTVNADSDINGTGAYTVNDPGAAVSSGAVIITAADIDLQGTINAGAAAVSLRPSQAAATIGIEDASKTFSLTDAELDNITTTGILTVGVATNTGGITIGTDGAVSQNKALTFLTSTGAITTHGALSTTGNKNIIMTTTNAPIEVNDTIDVAGSGTVTLTAAGAVNGAITFNNAISSGSGAISLTAANGITLSGANADVTTTGAYTAIADSDANGTGIYAQNDAGSAVSSAQVVITAQDIDLQGTINAGAANVFLRPALAATTIGVEDASKTFQLTSTELDNITTTGILTVGIATNTGGITIGTDGAVSQNKALTFLTSTGAITTNGALSTTGNKNIIMTTTNAPIAVNGSIDVAGSGSVTLTAAGAINGAITLNNAISSGSGAVNLTAANGITLSGANADVTTTGAHTVSADSDANGTGMYTINDSGAAVSSGTVTITAADIDLQGTINAGAAAVILRPSQAAATIGIEDASKTFSLTDAELDNITTTGILTVGVATNTGGITIGTDGAVSQNKALTFLTSTGAITTNGALSTTGNKNIIMTTTNAPIAVNGSIDVAGSGTVTLTAAGAVNGAITFDNAISSGSGAIILTAANGVTLSGVNADVTTTGAYTAVADSDANGTGIYTQSNAGSAVSSGAVTITAADIDLQGTIDAGAAAVSLRASQAAATIGVEDASKNFKLSDAELDSITTSGILTVGANTNTGGITIGTDGAVSQNKALTFATGTGTITTNGALSTTGNKNIVMGTTNAPININGAIDAAGSGTVTLTAGGAVNGTLTLNNAITSGSGAIALSARNGITLSGASSDITTAAAYTANADSDANGTGIYSQQAGAAVMSGSVYIAAETINLLGSLHAGSGTVALTALDGVLLSGPDADITTTGAYTADADRNANGSGSYSQNDAGSAVSAGLIRITAQDIDLRGTLDAGASYVTLGPSSASATIGIGDTGQSFNVSNAEIAQVTTTGALLIGGEFSRDGGRDP